MTQKQTTNQLHRIQGQLRAVERMIEQKHDTFAIVQQLDAVRGSLCTLEQRLLKQALGKKHSKEIEQLLRCVFRTK